MTEMRTGRGLDRLVNFSDATVAIAITLLILPLVDAATHIGNRSFADFFAENVWELFAFAISFGVISRFWMVHHRIFEGVRQYSQALLLLNFAWLFAIVLIPFSANVLSSGNGYRPDVFALYIGNLLLATLSSWLIGLVLRLNQDLMTDEARASIDPTAGLPELCLIALALVLAVLVPSVGMFWLFLLFLSGPLHRLLRPAVARRGRDDRPSRTGH